MKNIYQIILSLSKSIFFYLLISTIIFVPKESTAQRCGVNGITFTPQAGFGSNSKIMIGGYGQNDGSICFNCYSDSTTFGRSRIFNKDISGMAPPLGSAVPTFSSRIFQDLKVGVLRIQSSPINNACYDSVTWSKGISVLTDGSIGIGTDATFGAKLAVNGMIYTKSDIKVSATLGWPDYVFTPGYKLPTINEYEKQVATLGYIPQIGSAETIEENGLILGEMQTKQMEVMEIMLRYQFEMNRRLDSLETVNQTLKVQLEKYEHIDSLLTQLLGGSQINPVEENSIPKNVKKAEHSITPSAIKKEDE